MRTSRTRGGLNALFLTCSNEQRHVLQQGWAKLSTVFSIVSSTLPPQKNITYANITVIPKERKLLKHYLKESLFLSKSVNGLAL